jgi:hypothetical protein
MLLSSTQSTHIILAQSNSVVSKGKTRDNDNCPCHAFFVIEKDTLEITFVPVIVLMKVPSSQYSLMLYSFIL